MAGATTATYAPSNCGSHNLTVTNSAGCQASSASVYVIGTSGNSPTRETATGNIFSNENGMNVYPNPNKGNFTVETSAKLVVSDMNGVVVFEKVITDLSQQHEINLEGYASGMYAVELYIGEAMISRKVIVQK